jgi:hypothetical protein
MFADTAPTSIEDAVMPFMGFTKKASTSFTCPRKTGLPVVYDSRCQPVADLTDSNASELVLIQSLGAAGGFQPWFSQAKLPPPPRPMIPEGIAV